MKGPSQPEASSKRLETQRIFFQRLLHLGLDVQQGRSAVNAATNAGAKSIATATTLCARKKLKWVEDIIIVATGLNKYSVSMTCFETAARAGGFKPPTTLRPYFPSWQIASQCIPKRPVKRNQGFACSNGDRVPQTDCVDVGKRANAAL